MVRPCKEGDEEIFKCKCTRKVGFKKCEKQIKTRLITSMNNSLPTNQNRALIGPMRIQHEFVLVVGGSRIQ